LEKVNSCRVLVVMASNEKTRHAIESLQSLRGLVFVLGVIVGISLRPHSVATATGSIQSWGLVEDPNSAARKVLVLYDTSTGEILVITSIKSFTVIRFASLSSPSRRANRQVVVRQNRVRKAALRAGRKVHSGRIVLLKEMWCFRP
jgi:hypothetical protein